MGAQRETEIPDGTTRTDVVEEKIRRLAYRDFLHFFDLTSPAKPYEFGRHTIAICNAMDRVTKRLEQGKCSYLAICVPPRHGKSDIASRRWPIWHLGRNPDHEIILAAYNDELATDLSYDARMCFDSPDYRWIFQHHLSYDRQSVHRWRIDKHKGTFFAAGIGGTIVGRGAHILAIDDYMKNREEAESAVSRDKVWDAFTTDLMTRRAPVHAIVITANRWHVDDLIGRIKNRNNPHHRDYDADFPVFEMLTFPAYDEKRKEKGKQPWLFTKRFAKSWYKSLRAACGSYGWSSIGLQEPKPRSGNMLKAGNIKILDDEEFDALSEGARWCRGYDIASTKKEKAKDDPDWSVGTLAGYKEGRIFVSHVVAGQWNALVRDQIIEDNVERDGSHVPIRIECVAGYLDTYVRVKNTLRGRAAVYKYVPHRDKVSRATFLESYFEAGEVYVRKADWNQAWIDEMLEFPSGKKDDRVDSLVTALHDMVVQTSRFRLTR